MKWCMHIYITLLMTLSLILSRSVSDCHCSDDRPPSSQHSADSSTSFLLPAHAQKVMSPLLRRSSLLSATPAPVAHVGSSPNSTREVTNRSRPYAYWFQGRV